MVTKVSLGIVSAVPSGTRRAGQSARATTMRLSISTHTEAYATTALVFDVGIDEADLAIDALGDQVDFSTGKRMQATGVHQQLHLIVQLVVHIAFDALLDQIDDVHEAGAAALLDAQAHGLARLTGQLPTEMLQRRGGHGRSEEHTSELQ